MTRFRKTVSAAVAAVTMTGALALSSNEASAWYRHRGYHGGAVAAGVIGALALGAIAASAYSARPAYACGYERRPVYNRWGDVVGFRRVPAC